jgi:hypothetical protein
MHDVGNIHQVTLFVAMARTYFCTGIVKLQDCELCKHTVVVIGFSQIVAKTNWWPEAEFVKVYVSELSLNLSSFLSIHHK